VATDGDTITAPNDKYYNWCQKLDQRMDAASQAILEKLNELSATQDKITACQDQLVAGQEELKRNLRAIQAGQSKFEETITDT
jgi:predicted  nucleic acid-binding Zn-ribbon protein